MVRPRPPENKWQVLRNSKFADLLSRWLLSEPAVRPKNSRFTRFRQWFPKVEGSTPLLIFCSREWNQWKCLRKTDNSPKSWSDCENMATIKQAWRTGDVRNCRVKLDFLVNYIKTSEEIIRYFHFATKTILFRGYIILTGSRFPRNNGIYAISSAWI